MKIHDLKVWPEFYADLLLRNKNFELRKNDRNFQVGDWLTLKEWNPVDEEYSGEQVSRLITYIFDPILHRAADFGIQEGYIILGF